MDEKIKYILKFCIFVLLMFALINIICSNLNDEGVEKEIVTIEGLEPSLEPIATGSRAFCDSYRGSSSSLNGACGKLTEKNCNETSCCVFTNKKCVAGNANGPTYKNGNTSILNYYFQNKCYGTNCPAALNTN